MGPSSCTFRKKWFLQNKWNHSSTEMKKSQLRPHRKSCSRNHHTCAPPPPKSPPAQSWCTRAWAISYLDYRPSGLLTSHSHLCLFAWLMVENPHSRDELLGLYPAPLPLSFLYASSLSAPPRKQHPQGNRKRETDISEMPAMPELASSVPGGSGQIWKRRPPPLESALCQSRICKLAQVSHASTERYQGDYTGMCRAQERQNLSGPERFTSSEDWLNPSFWNKKVTGSTQSPRGLYSTISLKVPWCEIQSETCFILTYVMIWCCFERDYSKEIITSMSMYNICEPYDYSTCQSWVQEMQIHITGFFFFSILGCFYFLTQTRLLYSNKMT